MRSSMPSGESNISPLMSMSSRLRGSIATRTPPSAGDGGENV